jgi:hypothetical protein
VYDERGNRLFDTQPLNGSPFGCANHMVGGSGGNGYYMTVVRNVKGRNGASHAEPCYWAGFFVSGSGP